MNLHAPIDLIDTAPAFLPPGLHLDMRTERLIQVFQQPIQPRDTGFRFRHASNYNHSSQLPAPYRLSKTALGIHPLYEVQ